MAAFYNEIEPFAAQWLRNLSEPGVIAPGVVDTRSIVDVRPEDVHGYTQCHFFAGLGGWSYALRLAGWPDDVPVWTGSCPCQPFSAAGARKGFDDERHLWPEWFRLIRECRPAVVFGEQVASPDGLRWLDVVLADLEGAGYAVGAADLCAAGVGAPHRRQRLWFVAVERGGLADNDQNRRRVFRAARLHDQGAPGYDAARRSSVRGLPDAACERWSEGRHPTRRDGAGSLDDRARSVVSAGDVADAVRIGQQGAGAAGADGSEASDNRGVGDARLDRDRQHARELSRDEAEHEVGAAHRNRAPVAAGATRGFWADCDWIPCRDGKLRPVEPGTFPLAHGVPARVGRLRAYGNSIVPQVAAIFIQAAIESFEVIP